MRCWARACPCWEQVVQSLSMPCMTWSPLHQDLWTRSPLHQDLCHQSPATKVPCPVSVHVVWAAMRVMPTSPGGHEPHTCELCLGGSGPGSFLLLVGLRCSAAWAAMQAASLPALGMLHCPGADRAARGGLVCSRVVFRQCCLQLLIPSSVVSMATCGPGELWWNCRDVQLGVSVSFCRPVTDVILA